MKTLKNVGICMILLIFTLLIVSDVFALGVSPARKIIEFSPELEIEVEFNVLNSEGKDMKVVIYVEGDNLDEEIIIDNPELIFSSGELQKSVKYNIKLPEKYDEPGTHEIKIVAREIPVDKAFEGTFVGASVAVVHIVRINVPYPGKYATVELKLGEDTGQGVDFIVYVNNFGTQKIVSAKGIIDVYGPTNEKLTSLETGLVSVDSGARKAMNVKWDENINSGKYYAKLTVLYDGNVAEYEKVFNVGIRLVDILDIIVKNFKLGGIAKFNILVENGWPEVISDVYTDLLISEKGQEIGRFKSAAEDIPALAKEELTAFWDTAGVEEGDYDAKISLYYDDKIVEKDMKTKISFNSISFSGFTGAVISDEVGGETSDTKILIGLVVILIIINLIWFVYFKFKKKK
ncbi:hypothetical protein HON86_02905 [Candidatus Woesearchaeota archaeon]|jgi:hypothetical protein|nr:hypothetical protein [Candidatus Woesearchaeota archaeon]MBT4835542.1 hypothetical protein [Candidatus Woesearchaeota archaeon]MBT6735015.1 hypothetical protein [Candidatus Woesearchaeota archaeon]MBT7169923.1 hypothetical protein [Candidatus Woesearchaeota archaeon]MBT7474647.1 hypothetical protein [Candidatus Woesearchaeota archaeon]